MENISRIIYHTIFGFTAEYKNIFYTNLDCNNFFSIFKLLFFTLEKLLRIKKNYFFKVPNIDGHFNLQTGSLYPSRLVENNFWTNSTTRKTPLEEEKLRPINFRTTITIQKGISYKKKKYIIVKSIKFVLNSKIKITVNQ